jgi:hypothetical protein
MWGRCTVVQAYKAVHVLMGLVNSPRSKIKSANEVLSLPVWNCVADLRSIPHSPFAALQEGRVSELWVSDESTLATAHVSFISRTRSLRKTPFAAQHPPLAWVCSTDTLAVARKCLPVLKPQYRRICTS